MHGLMMDQPLLISAMIEHAAKFHSDVEIVSRGTNGVVTRSTWGDVARRAKKLANALARHGIKPGDRVATLAWNNQRHLELYFAVSGMGAVLHTLNPRLAPEHICFIVDDAKDAALFFDATFAKADELLASRIPFRVELGDAYEALLARESDQLEWPVLDERTASSLCYTSGTAGNPKGVLYSHRSTVLHSYAACMADALALSGAEVVLPVVPMFHVNAWGVPYAAAMCGAKLVLPGPGLDGKNICELIETERVTTLLGVPTVWANLLGFLKSENKKLGTVSKVVIGGSACPGAMIEAFERVHGARVIHAWGMTETSPVGTVNVMLPKHERLAYEDTLPVKLKQGRAIFGIDMRIVDERGVVLPHDGKSAGELQVRGPWVASGYFNVAHSGAHTDGWFATGDIATLDADGYMQITDRTKDVIKSGGEWVSSIDVENAALSQGEIAAAACIGVKSDKWGERPLLVVVKAPGKEPSAPAILEHLRTKLVKWQVPDAVEFVEALPIGPTGKVLKRVLRERFKDVVLG